MTKLQATKINEIEDHILSLETQRYQAMLNGNIETIQRLSHPDLIYTHSDGSQDDLETYSNKLEEAFYVYNRISHPSDQVIVTGDTALVVGRMDADISVQGMQKTLKNRSLAVWVRCLDRWQFVAFQGTPSD